jgi:LysM repeat protein
MNARLAEPEVVPVDVAPDARGLEICPYLLAEDRRSRRATAWRGHRCTAVVPASPLALDKQRRLCLRAEHRSCATFLAARGVGGATAGAGVGGVVDLERVTRWSIVRTTPTVLDPGSPVSGILERLSGTAGQAALAGVLVAALAAVAAGQTGLLGNPGGSEAAASATPATTATPAATSAQPTPTPAATPVPTLAATPASTTAPTASPLATATTTYVVQGGDTLWAISIQFGTTVQALQELNDLGTSTRLVVGQVLEIP